MPIYEFAAKNPDKACDICLEGFEYSQKITSKLISRCPHCGNGIKQMMSTNTFICLGDGWTRSGCD